MSLLVSFYEVSLFLHVSNKVYILLQSNALLKMTDLEMFSLRGIIQGYPSGGLNDPGLDSVI